MIRNMIDGLFNLACKLIVLVCAVAYVLDKAVDINLFKLF